MGIEFDLKLFNKYKGIIGCDEVGRGPIAGPVNGCAALITEENKNLLTYLSGLKITDSKKLTSKKRLAILKALNIEISNLKINRAYKVSTLYGDFHFVIGEKSPLEIDNINILQASLQCMKEASEHFLNRDHIILIDGNKTFEAPSDTEAIIKGDSKSIVIGIASIIAKEYRDYIMRNYDQEYPGYGFSDHAGYPTVKHKEAVKELGVTPIHRKSFKGVKEYV